jgi:hypothetical protein
VRVIVEDSAAALASAAEDFGHVVRGSPAGSGLSSAVLARPLQMRFTSATSFAWPSLGCSPTLAIAAT